MNYFLNLINNQNFKILGIVIVFDVVLGTLRALREKSLNSTIGIDGIIRKSAMLISIVFLTLIDYIMKLDLLGFVPEIIKSTLNLKDVGISDLFMILFDIFEILSIFKNMILCKLPIPKKLQNFLENVLEEFTNENNKSKEEK